MANIFLVSHILLSFQEPKGSWNKSAKYEKLGKYWSYCTRNRAITDTSDRVEIEILISAEKISEKDVLWKKDVQKTLIKIHKRYLWGSLLPKSQVMQLFQKITSLISVFEEVWSQLQLYSYEDIIVWKNLFFTILVTVISKYKIRKI